MYLHCFTFKCNVFRLFQLITVSLLCLSTASFAQTYKLATGDRLRITLLENDQVDDVYVVEIDGTVSVPGIGVVDAFGLDVRQFEQKLLQVASSKIVDPSISVQIVEYRPFFVLGDVDQSGIYPYTPGLNVMKAVAIAGGFGRQVNTDELSQAIAANQARKSMAEGDVELFSAQVNLARLKAERDMAETFTFDAGKLTTANKEVVENAKTLFETRQNAFKVQLDKLNAALAARTEEIDSYQSQIDLQNEVLETSKEDLRKIQDAKQRGLVSDARVSEITRIEQNVRAQILQIVTLKRQSEVNHATVEREIADLKVNRAVNIDQTIQVLEDTTQRIKARVREDRAMLNEIGAGSVLAVSGEPSYRIELHRNGEKLDQDIALNTPVNPGDTLFIILNNEELTSN